MAALATSTGPIAAEIQEIEAAIQTLKESTDPLYVARPWRRRDLIEELSERIAQLRTQEAEQAQAAAERARRAQLQAAWDALAPKREALALRWGEVRQLMREVLAAAQALDREHLAQTERRALSEGLVPTSFLSARLEVIDNSPVLVRPADSL